MLWLQNILISLPATTMPGNHFRSVADLDAVHIGTQGQGLMRMRHRNRIAIGGEVDQGKFVCFHRHRFAAGVGGGQRQKLRLLGRQPFADAFVASLQCSLLFQFALLTQVDVQIIPVLKTTCTDQPIASAVSP